MKENYLFWERTAESYDIRHKIPMIDYLRKEEKKVLLKEINKKDLVVDVGCGTGWPSLMLYEKGYNVVGFDFSEEFLKILKKKNKNVVVFKQDCTEEFDEKLYNYFDVAVSCLSFLNYVENWKKAIENISKILKQKAKIIISIAISEKENFKKIRTDKEKLIIHEFDLKDIVSEFKKYAFKIKKTRYLFSFIKPRWGDFRKFSFKEKILLLIEKILNSRKNAKLAIIVLERK